MSYETYALVRDRVRARPLEPIDLKGISRQVRPYVIEGIYEERLAAESDTVEQDTDRLHLHVDLTDLAANEGEEIEAALRSALKEVKKRRKRDV